MQIGTRGRQRDGDAAAAGAHIDDARAARNALNGSFDEQLCLGPRDQNAIVDVKLASEKLGLAANVLPRLAREPAAHQRLDLRVIDLGLPMCNHPCGRPADEIREEHVDIA